MPARYYNTNNYETYKGGGIINSLIDATGYGSNLVKNTNNYVNGVMDIGFNKVAKGLNTNLRVGSLSPPLVGGRKRGKNMRNMKGGNGWLNTHNSWGSVNTPSMSESQFKMFNKTTPYMTNEQLAPGSVGGKAQCIGDNKILAYNAFNGVSV